MVSSFSTSFLVFCPLTGPTSAQLLAKGQLPSAPNGVGVTLKVLCSLWRQLLLLEGGGAVWSLPAWLAFLGFLKFLCRNVLLSLSVYVCIYYLFKPPRYKIKYFLTLLLTLDTNFIIFFTNLKGKHFVSCWLNIGFLIPSKAEHLQKFIYSLFIFLLLELLLYNLQSYFYCFFLI